MRSNVASHADVAMNASWYDNEEGEYGQGFATCYANPHAYMVMGNTCTSRSDWEAGCGFQEVGDSRHSFKSGVGFNNEGYEEDAEIVFGFIPGVGSGGVHEHGNYHCPKAISWQISDACARAIVADLAPKYDEHRAWTWSQALNPKHWHPSTGYRSQGCGWFSGLSARSYIKRKSRLWKPKQLCWDFVSDFKSLYCESQNWPWTRAPYKKLCSYSRDEWSDLHIVEKAQIFKDMDDNMMQKKERAFLTKSARAAVDSVLTGR